MNFKWSNLNLDYNSNNNNANIMTWPLCFFHLYSRLLFGTRSMHDIWMHANFELLFHKIIQCLGKENNGAFVLKQFVHALIF
jgi:hypothetical protein